MNAIQSFWISDNSTKNGGWVNKRFESIGWSLSFFLLKKNFGGVRLYCNSAGQKFLVDELGLDYAEIHKDLDEIEDLTKKWWSLAKMHTYASQKEPFVHADGDVFWFDLPDTEFLNTDLFAQCLEIDVPLYKHILLKIKKYIPDYPDYLDLYQNPLAANAGIVGGQNFEFFKEFYTEVLKFLKDNLENIENNPIDFKFLFIYIEQAFFICLANHQKIKIKFLKKPVFRVNFHSVVNFSRISPLTKTPGFLHILGSHRFRIQNCNSIEFWLHRLWPEQLEKIDALYPALENTEKDLTIFLNPDYEKLLPDAKWLIDKPTVVLQYPFMRTSIIFGINVDEYSNEQLVSHSESQRLLDCIKFEKRRIEVLTDMLNNMHADFLYKHFEAHLDFCAKDFNAINNLKFEPNQHKVLRSEYNWFNGLKYNTQNYWYNLIIDSQKTYFQEFILSETECRIMELVESGIGIEDLYLAWGNRYPKENNKQTRILIHETIKELIMSDLIRVC